MGRDFLDEKLLSPLVVRVFPQDEERLKEIVKENPEKYETVSHAVRCSIQHFIKEWGDI